MFIIIYRWSVSAERLEINENEENNQLLLNQSFNNSNNNTPLTSPVKKVSPKKHITRKRGKEIEKITLFKNEIDNENDNDISANNNSRNKLKTSKQNQHSSNNHNIHKEDSLLSLNSQIVGKEETCSPVKKKKRPTQTNTQTFDSLMSLTQKSNQSLVIDKNEKINMKLPKETNQSIKKKVSSVKGGDILAMLK